jgi:hypothetical protein
MKAFSAGELILKTTSATMTILFTFWASYQINDPDSFLWMLVYGAAAALSLLYVVNRLRTIIPLILGGVCLLWAGYLSTQITYEPPLVAIEEWREMMGLLIVFAWMGLLTWRSRQSNRLQTYIREKVLAKSSSGGTDL